MSAPIQTVTTSASGLNRLWRKVQGQVQTGFQFLCEEWTWMDKLTEFKIDWSFREITTPVDLNRGFGASSMVEGGWEAIPSSPNLEEITINWIHLNKRFNASMQAMWVSQQDAAAAITNQLVYQGQKALQTVAADFSDKFYGYSNATVCLTDTDTTAATTATLTLKTLYGDTNIGNATNTPAAQLNAFLADKFVVGERIALLSPTGADTLAAANTIGTITAINRSTPSITVTWIGTAGVVSTNDLRIVKMNNIDPTNAVASSDINKGLTGLLDMSFSSSLHGLTHANWTANTDTSGGRFSGPRLQYAKDLIANTGGGNANAAIMAQGVNRDLVLQYQAGVRYSSPMGIEIDGSVKAQGFTFNTGRRVLPGSVTVYDKSNSVKRGTLLKKPSKGPNWGDGRKLENQSAMVFQVDYPCFMVCTNRRNIATFGNLVESY